MDAKVSWRISPDVDLLVGAIAECKKLLIACVKRRNPYCRSLKLLWCDVHASPKLVELLHVSDLWTDHRETTEEVDLRRAKRPYSQEVVADFIAFRLVKDDIVGDESIRVVTEFQVANDDLESYFGNVEMVT